MNHRSHVRNFEAACPAFYEQHEYVGMAVYGESKKARVGNGKERHPMAIRVGYHKVEETGASDQTCETGM